MTYSQIEQAGRPGTIGGNGLCFNCAIYCSAATTDYDSACTVLLHTEETVCSMH